MFRVLADARFKRHETREEVVGHRFRNARHSLENGKRNRPNETNDSLSDEFERLIAEWTVVFPRVVASKKEDERVSGFRASKNTLQITEGGSRDDGLKTGYLVFS